VHHLRSLRRWLVGPLVFSFAGLEGCGARTSLLSQAPGSGDDSGSLAECGAPSCAPGGSGMTNCGAASECCCTSLQVSGGTFYRAYDKVNPNYDGGFQLSPDGGASGELDSATVSTFRLDKYLVTVGRFRQFVNAWSGGAGYLPPAGSGKHTYLNGGRESSMQRGLVRNVHVDTLSWGEREPAHELRELVRGVRLLHLGWWVSAE
jgi:hypothetical protein